MPYIDKGTTLVISVENLADEYADFEYPTDADFGSETLKLLCNTTDIQFRFLDLNGILRFKVLEFVEPVE